MKVIKHKRFANGIVYALQTDDGYLIETTDTFLPYYTKNAIGKKQNILQTHDLEHRGERWMIGFSVMSGCPVGCKFCATGKMKRCRNLKFYEILDQVEFVLNQNPGYKPEDSKEFKINYTRMGEPFLNIDNVVAAIEMIDGTFTPTRVHHYVSTIGVEGSDFSWIKDNITLQVSVHSFDEEYRDWLIPFPRKMSLENLGKIRTESDLKATVNLTMARNEDWDVDKLKKWFDPDHFFIKISPINENETSKNNDMGAGIIGQVNLV